MKKFVTILMACLLLLSCFSIFTFADESYSYGIEDFKPNYKEYDPIPLLIVVISFDANGNGIDDYKRGGNVKDSSSDCYGEQWAYSKESYWENEVFGTEGKTLNNYYKYNSFGKFYFTPCKESYGTEDNGVVYVTINYKHPHASSGSMYSQYGQERHLALQAASEYVDFASYDKDKDGNIDYTELSISFIIAGFNAKFTTSGTKDQYFGMNNFEVSTSTWYCVVDDVKLLNSSTGGRFTYNGEYMAENQPIAFGTIAHELGHVLGANDLYTYSGYTWCGGPGEAALQGGGSYLGYYGELQGKSPAAIDPYYLINFGFANYEIANDGEYTLYSKESKLGDYNILRVNTTNPFEYYLIENRYYTGTDTYDAIDTNAKGIMIWHVDDLIMKSYSLPNCYKSSSPHAPGLTPLYPNGGIGGSIYNAWDKDDGIFDSKNYKFFNANSCYTLMSEEEAKEAGFNFTLEVLTKNGTETKVKISGTIDIAPEFKISCANDLTNEVFLKGNIIRLNNSTLTQLKCEISKKNDFSNSQILYAKPNSLGYFEFDFKELDEKSTYYYRVTAESSNGNTVINGKAYTVSPPNQNKEYYTAFMYRFLSDANRPYELKVKIGEKIKYSFPMTKPGYVLGGWYYDQEYTKPYDMNSIKEDNQNIYLYARWIKEEESISIEIKDVEYSNVYFAISLGEKFDEPDYIVPQGKVFAGWYLDPTFENEFSFDTPIDEAGNITVYAKWNDEVQTEETTKIIETTQEPIIETTQNETTNIVQPTNQQIPPVLLFTIIIASVIFALIILLVIVKRIKGKK